MSTDLLVSDEELEFPSSDGKPMSENTRQYEAIVTLKGNIEAFTPADAFVAGDHMIYVDRNNDKVRQAPDVYVAFGRPRGHRGSYFVWEEDNVFPQVIFEVLAPSNTETEMLGKRDFYFRYGAEEYYEFDPEAGTWIGVVRNAASGQPVPVPDMLKHVSPACGCGSDFGRWSCGCSDPTARPSSLFRNSKNNGSPSGDGPRKNTDEPTRPSGRWRRPSDTPRRPANGRTMPNVLPRRNASGPTRHRGRPRRHRGRRKGNASAPGRPSDGRTRRGNTPKRNADRRQRPSGKRQRPSGGRTKPGRNWSGCRLSCVRPSSTRTPVHVRPTAGNWRQEK